MPSYLLQVLKGKEKKIMELLARHGLKTQRAALTEYLLTDDPRCYEIRRRDAVKGYILTISEISPKVACELLSMPDRSPSDPEKPSPNRLVRILTGEWAGRVGLVSSMEDDTVTLHAEAFGRLRCVRVPVDDVEVYHAPEAVG
jgi:hypothetical protein